MTGLPLLHEFDRQTVDTRPTLHLAHANGFPPEVYAALVAPLSAHYRVVMLPARPLWPDPPPPASLSSWQVFAADLIAGIEAHHLGQVVGVGHSLGGTVTLLASIQRPDLFSAIILIDPVALPRWFLRWLRAMRAVYPHMQVPLAKMALRRRRSWASREEAFQRFRERPLFARCSDETVWAYVDGLTRSSPNGAGEIELRYSPEWEARIYNHVPTDIWRWVRKISVPGLVLRGEASDTFRVESARLWQKLRPDLPVVTLPNVGHLLPIEQPAAVADAMLSFLNKLRRR